MELDSGDLLLVSGKSMTSRCIECMSNSSYSHVGIILKHPIYLNQTLKDEYYVLETMMHSTINDAEDRVLKSGVQIHKLQDVIAESEPGTLFVRRVTAPRDIVFRQALKKIHDDVHNKPYDTTLTDWLVARYNLSFTLPVASSHQSKKEFWCSALVSYVFVELGWLPKDLNWSLVCPIQFSSGHPEPLPFRVDVSDDTLFH